MPERSARLPGVRKYRGLRLDLDRTNSYLVVPSGVVMVITLEGSVRLGGVRPGADPGLDTSVPRADMIAGLHSKALSVQHDRNLHAISVVLDPWAAYGLFNLPMSTLADTVVGTSDLLGPGAPELVSALRSTPGWGGRFELLEAWLAQELAGRPAYAPPVVHAWRELSRAGGAIPVEALASRVGWCRRNLERRFREQVGLSPKMAARMLRLRRAFRLLRGGHTINEVASRCRYYDQAHFVNDFKSLAGRTPGEFLSGYPAASAALVV
ncbi:helix-turn-helix domain-containing protein [Flindersiella endophytica]